MIPTSILDDKLIILLCIICANILIKLIFFRKRNSKLINNKENLENDKNKIKKLCIIDICTFIFFIYFWTFTYATKKIVWLVGSISFLGIPIFAYIIGLFISYKQYKKNRKKLALLIYNITFILIIFWLFIIPINQYNQLNKELGQEVWENDKKIYSKQFQVYEGNELTGTLSKQLIVDVLAYNDRTKIPGNGNKIIINIDDKDYIYSNEFDSDSFNENNKYKVETIYCENEHIIKIKITTNN